ncbi:MAG: ABC transporter ATP-binding protein, partial [Bacteroidota bacterium]
MTDTPNSLWKDLKLSWGHLLRPERRRMGVLLGASFLTIGVDLLSLAAILPVVLMVLQPDFWETAPIPDFLKEELLSWPLRTRQVAVLLTTLVLFLLKNAFGYFVQRERISFFKNLIVRLSQQSYRHIVEGTSLQAFLERHGGEGIQQLVFIPANFVNNVLKGIFAILTEGGLLLVLISVMLIYDPPVFFTAIVALTPGILLLIYLRKRTTQRIGGTMKKIFNEYLQYVVETVRGYLDINLSGRQDRFVDQHTERSQHFHHSQQKILFLNLTTPRLVESAAVMGIVSILGYLVFTEATAMKATVTLGIFLAGTYKLIPSLTALISAYGQLNTHRFTIQEIKSLLPEDTKEKPVQFQESVALSQVSFAYGTGTFALRDVSFSLSKGEKIALMGPSGGGKTTLIHLLLGLFTPLCGIQCNPVYLQATAQGKGWRRLVSYVPQTPLLLETSLAENIAFGVPEDEID